MQLPIYTTAVKGESDARDLFADLYCGRSTPRRTVPTSTESYVNGHERYRLFWKSRKTHYGCCFGIGHVFPQLVLSGILASQHNDQRRLYAAI